MLQGVAVCIFLDCSFLILFYPFGFGLITLLFFSIKCGKISFCKTPCWPGTSMTKRVDEIEHKKVD